MNSGIIETIIGVGVSVVIAVIATRQARKSDRKIEEIDKKTEPFTVRSSAFKHIWWLIKRNGKNGDSRNNH